MIQLKFVTVELERQLTIHENLSEDTENKSIRLDEEMLVGKGRGEMLVGKGRGEMLVGKGGERRDVSREGERRDVSREGRGEERC